MHVKFAAIQTLPPIGKQKRYSPQLLTYIQALEIDPPAGRPPIDWKLVTNLPVGNFAIAIEKLEWYALRWKAEVFHKVMKSGCRAEEARLETAERLTKFLALIAMVSWRIFFLTMSARAKPEAAPETVLTPTEIATLDAIHGARAKPRILRKTLATYLSQIAMLGGYLARNHDPPPRKHGRVARPNTSQRHRLRSLNQSSSTMWAIESSTGGLRRGHSKAILAASMSNGRCRSISSLREYLSTSPLNSRSFR